MNNLCTLADLLPLGTAIREGKSYHIFEKDSGHYLESRYFPVTAANVARDYKTRGKSVIVKYLTNQDHSVLDKPKSL